MTMQFGSYMAPPMPNGGGIGNTVPGVHNFKDDPSDPGFVQPSSGFAARYGSAAQGKGMPLSNSMNYKSPNAIMPAFDANLQGKITALTGRPQVYAPQEHVTNGGVSPGVYNGPNAVQAARGYAGPPPQQNTYNPHQSVLAAYNQPTPPPQAQPAAGMDPRSTAPGIGGTFRPQPNGGP